MTAREIFCNQRFAFTMALGAWWGFLCTMHDVSLWINWIGAYVIGRYIGWRLFR